MFVRRMLRTVCTASALALGMLAATSSWAQITNPGGSGAANGVIVDADGVLHRQIVADPTGQIHRERVAAARAQLDPEIAKPSKLRKVSLTRLEAAIAAQLDKNQPPTDEMLRQDVIEQAGVLRGCRRGHHDRFLLCQGRNPARCKKG